MHVCFSLGSILFLLGIDDPASEMTIWEVSQRFVDSGRVVGKQEVDSFRCPLSARNRRQVPNEASNLPTSELLARFRRLTATGRPFIDRNQAADVRD